MFKAEYVLNYTAFFFWWYWVSKLGFTLARQALYLLSHSASQVGFKCSIQSLTLDRLLLAV
jgi:hypothetical protein